MRQDFDYEDNKFRLHIIIPVRNKYKIAWNFCRKYA